MVIAKDEKELFVTGHSGTTPGELLLVCGGTVCAGAWCCTALLSSYKWLHTRPMSVEAATFWIPMILCQSQWLYPWGVLYLTLELVVAIGISFVNHNNATKPMRGRSRHNNTAFLTMYRSALMYLTFVAILAVDFPLYPRRFAKTETQGYGLMDLGAASFVVAAGLVSPLAKRRKLQKSCINVRRLLPLLGMGMLRLVTHKGIDYQEHASEYGVHWNFFFTLAALPVLTHLVVVAVPSQWVSSLVPHQQQLLLLLVLPCLWMGVYQWMLSQRGLQEWIETSPRQCQHTKTFFFLCDVWVANREGILGCLGYASLYMVSEWIGATLLWSPRNTSRQWLWVVWGVSVWLWYLLVYVLDIPVSRRSTNASFLSWVLVVNLPILAVLEQVTSHTTTWVSRALNRHGLVCFVVANLLTGAVNLGMENTMNVPDFTAMVILLIYMTAIGVLAVVLEAVEASFIKNNGNNG